MRTHEVPKTIKIIKKGNPPRKTETKIQHACKNCGTIFEIITEEYEYSRGEIACCANGMEIIRVECPICEITQDVMVRDSDK